MGMHILEREQLVRRPIAEVFEFFSQPGKLEQITPPFLRFTVLTPAPIEMRVGALIEYRLAVHGIPLRWLTRIDAWEPGRAFEDRQLRGPYQLWHHRHEFVELGACTLVRDIVHYVVPLGWAGELARVMFVQRDLDEVFAYRREAVKRWLE